MSIGHTFSQIIIKLKNADNIMAISVLFSYRGAGGSRTLVQTRKQYTFYMLIFVYIFVLWQDQSYQPKPYLLSFHSKCEAI